MRRKWSTIPKAAPRPNKPTHVSSTAADNDKHGNYLRDNTNRLLDKLLVEGQQAVPYA